MCNPDLSLLALGFAACVVGVVGCSQTNDPAEGAVEGETESASSSSDGGSFEELSACLEDAQEPLEHLPRMAAGAEAYFFTAREGERISGIPLHRCPTDHEDPEVGEAAGPIVPHISLDCARAENGLCIPIPPEEGGGEDRYYDYVWERFMPFPQLGFSMDEPHRFHYQFVSHNAASGFGECRFTAQAFGNLDDDYSLHSTYLLTGRLSEAGAEIGAVEWVHPCN